MKIQTRILLVLFVIFSLFAVLAVWSGLSEIQKEKTVFKQKVIEKGKLFDEVMELKGASARSQAADYTFWDEMVLFAEKKLGKEWATENIDASLMGFKTNAAWVYDVDVSLVYSASNLVGKALKELPVSADAVKQLFSDRSFSHFFAKTDLGVMEIFGATIHPTNDPKRLTPPKGYFFVGTLWDADYIAYFSRIFEGAVEIVPPEEADGAVEDLAQGTIYFTKTLYKWDETPLVDVRVASHSESLRVIYHAFKQRLVVFGIFAAGILGIMAFVLLRWVNRPLKMIWDSLENEKIDRIAPLEKESTEYGMIAKLIRRSFEQKESLQSEIAFRRLAEEQLQYSKDQMELLYRLVPSAIFTVDMNRRVTSWNNMAAEITGYKADEVIGRECAIFAEASCKEKCGLYADDVPKPIRGRECVIRRKDGELRFVSNNADYLKDPDGNIIGGIESFEDITERKKVEQELVESEEKFKAISFSAGDAIVIMGNDGNCVFWNRAAENIFGYTREEMLGKNVHSMLAPQKFYAEYEKTFPHWQVSGEGEAVGKTVTLPAIRKDGVTIDVELSLSSVKIHDQWHAIGIVRDITERKQFEEKLEEWSKTLEQKVKERTEELQKSQEKLARSEKLALIGQLSSQVSHELRTPLTAIKNAAYLIHMYVDEGKTDKIAEYVDLISKEVDVTTQVISNTLGFAKRKPLDRKESDINDVLRECVSISVVPANIKVTPVYNETLPRLNIDPVQIRQVFVNIVKNAVDALSGGGELTISLTSDATYLTAEFKDTGIGISKENMKKIFDPLFSTSPRGTGLGLPVCQQIIESHGGLIEVESEEGKGTVFRIKLPLHAEAV